MHRGILVPAIAIAFAACNPFHSKPAVQLNPGEVDAAHRWNATLATPPDLAGAIQVRGNAWMKAAGDNSTQVHVDISNAAPGGVHPWMVHSGTCGNDQGVVGSAANYQPLKVNNDGVASQTTTIPVAVSSGASYFIAVHASAANMSTIVACGNLAPPLQ